MKNIPGYPLPDGELGEDEIVCQLVYLPDRPEYWQAFLGALHYMTTWRAWERDDDKRGRDAASNWRDAFELTIGCWRMTCLEQLQNDVAAILAIMQLGNSCCDDQDVTDGDRYTDRVEDGEGDVPQNIIDAGYATDTSDWAGFDDYKCMISHVIVDQLNAKLLELAEIVTPYGFVAGGLAAVAGILAVIFSTAGLAIVFGIVAGVGSVSLLYQAIIGFDSLTALAAKVVTNHDALVCAVYQSDGDAGALAALNDKIDELFTSVEAVILKNMNLGPTLKALYAGRYDQQDIAEELEAAGYDLGDFNCGLCDMIGEYRIFDDWNDGSYYPTDKTGIQPVFMNDGGEYYFRWSWSFTESKIYMSVLGLREFADLAYEAGDTVTIRQIKITYRMNQSPGVALVRLYDDTGYREYELANTQDWTIATITPSPAKVATYNLNDVWRIMVDGQLMIYLYVKNIEIDFDAST